MILSDSLFLGYAQTNTIPFENFEKTSLILILCVLEYHLEYPGGFTKITK